MGIVKVSAWLMVAGGLFFGLLFLALAISPPHARAGSTLTAESFRHVGVTAAYLSSAMALIGAGLTTRRPWAWAGAVNLSLILTCAAVAIFIYVGIKSSKPSALIGVIVLASLFVTPGSLLMWSLLQRTVREAFSLDARLWVHVITVGLLISSGLEILEPLNPKPRAIFGALRNVPLLDLYAVAIAIAHTVVGLWLYRLNETARRWTIGLYIFGIIEYSTWAIRDSETPAKLGLRITVILFSLAITGIIVWYLHTRRWMFVQGKPSDSDESEFGASRFRSSGPFELLSFVLDVSCLRAV